MLLDEILNRKIPLKIKEGNGLFKVVIRSTEISVILAGK